MSEGASFSQCGKTLLLLTPERKPQKGQAEPGVKELLRRLRQENSKLKVSPGYRMNSNPAWET